MRLIEKLIDSIDQTEERMEAFDLLGQAMNPEKGGDRRSEYFRTDIIRSENSDGSTEKDAGGTSREAGLRRLRKDRPDLHIEVVAGRLSTHAAMVRAGFRKRKISIPVGAPADTAKALRRNLEPDQIAELVQLLTADE